MDQDITEALAEQVREAAARRIPLAIEGGATKAFLGRRPRGHILEVSGHSGVVNYDPRELVITARAGTPLLEVEAALARGGQILAFEPPHFGAGATLGGTIACALSGPRRPFAGAARDFVLGTRVLSGTGEVLRFGGEVMKNVAGYDLSRLMTGALGTLGVLLEISLKVLPRPAEEITVAHECTLQEASQRLQQWLARPLPISAACHDGERLYIRLSGSTAGVAAARTRLGGDENAAGDFWERLREHTLEFFSQAPPLWRLSLPMHADVPALPGEQLVDWGGAQRWLMSDVDAITIRALAQQVGGHATLFRGGDREGEVFHPLAPPLFALHQRLKRALDPEGILNPGRLYPSL